MRLAMSILVRDEADVIEANIRHHANLGVAKFIVTDNASVDGTREILNRLSDEFDITIIDEPSLTIDQDLWVTRMAHELQASDAADWVINNDADEFWLASDHDSLPEAITAAIEQAEQDEDKIGVLYCPRNNLIPSREAVNDTNYHFTENTYQVLKDWTGAREVLDLPEQTAALLDQGQHVIIRTLPGKVITRLNGLESISMGNHGAEHQLDKIDVDFIEVAHYPIRDYQQFEKKVINYGSAIENNERFGAMISLHLRRWYDSHKRGTLKLDYDAIVIPKAILEHLVMDTTLAHTSLCKKIKYA